MDTWNAPTVQPREVDRKNGPGRPKMTWKQLTERDRREGSSQLSTLMIETSGDLV